MEIEIIEALDVPSAAMGRLGKLDKWVTYRVDGTRVYSITVPQEEATEEAIMRSIQEAEQVRGKLIGKKFTV